MGRRLVLKLKSISAKAIRSFNLFQKPALYAVVSLVSAASPDQPPAQCHQTPADRYGGENPDWDFPIRFTLDSDLNPDLVLRFDLTLQGSLLLLGDRIVGEVRVPVSDLVAEATPGAARHVSYQVRSPDGKPNGVLSFSYKVRDPEASIPFPALLPAMAPPEYYPPQLENQALFYPTPPENPAVFCPPPPPLPPAVWYPPVDVGYFYGADSAVCCPSCPREMGRNYPPLGHPSYYPPLAPDRHQGRGLTGYDR